MKWLLATLVAAVCTQAVIAGPSDPKRWRDRRMTVVLHSGNTTLQTVAGDNGGPFAFSRQQLGGAAAIIDRANANAVPKNGVKEQSVLSAA